MHREVFALALWMFVGVACQGGAGKDRVMDEATAAVNDEVVAGVEAWRQERLANLTQPDSWLSLVGLVWLDEGEHAIGSAPGHAVPLPASAPADLGMLRLQDATVTLQLADGQSVSVNGEAFGGGELAPDTSGAATVVEVGTVNFHVIERQGRYGVRIKDSQAETLTDFQGLDYYDASLRWRVVARVLPYDPPKMIPVPNVLGTPVDTESPAALEFYLEGTIHRLDALPGGDDGSFFLVFGDRTNAATTYGGGRFLYTEAPDADGKVLVDFNRAYNPPCVFTPYATCPLPPQQNKLPVLIEAGEKVLSGRV